MFRLEGVSRSYTKRSETVIALDNVHLQIEQGEYVAVVGPSGSGKSTLLSILGAMLAPTRGEVYVAGQAVLPMTPGERAKLRREKIGFVFQSLHLIPYLTALENVQVPLCLAGVPVREQRAKAEALLDRMGLAARMHHKPSELSLGQQQRVAVAWTLANDPPIVLADEPTGSLDPHTRDEILDLFATLHAEGRTLVVVTHDPQVAAKAERTLHLNAGMVSEANTRLRVVA